MGEFVCNAISLFLFSDEENVILHQIRKVQRTFARQKNRQRFEILSKIRNRLPGLPDFC
jgi:hypothetical protein